MTMLPAVSNSSSASGLGNAMSSFGSQLMDFGAETLGFNMSRSASSKEAKRNRAFQMYMANTAYQRAAKDLDKAGLNRILALGSPAATPSGASFTAPRVDIAPVESAAAKQAMELSRNQQSLVQQQARIARAEAGKAELEKYIYEVFAPEVKALVDGFRNSMTGGKDWTDQVRDFGKLLFSLNPLFQGPEQFGENLMKLMKE